MNFFTGLLPEEFDRLFCLIEDDLYTFAENRLNQDPQHPASPKEMLAITLTHLRLYASEEVLGVMFGFTQQAVSMICSHVLDAINSDGVERSFVIPVTSLTAGFGSKIGELKGVCVAVDTTDIHFQLNRNDEHYREFVVPYKKKLGPAFKILIGVTVKGGYLCFVSKEIYTSPTGDQPIVRLEKLDQTLIEKQIWAIGDKGFIGFKDCIVTPMKKPTDTELNVEEKNFNKLVSSKRAIIENFNSRLKEWAIMGLQIRGIHYSQKDKISKIIHACVYLTGLQLQTHPLRAGTTPPQRTM